MYLRICTVDEVDAEARTVDCTPVDGGAPLLGVNLQADQRRTDGLVAIPQVGSDVVVGFISPAVAVVVLCTEITEVRVGIGDTSLVIDSSGAVWNGGNETVANATELRDQLNLMSARIDAIINALPSATTIPSDGGASYNSTVAALKELRKEDMSRITDDKIRH